MSPSRRRPPQRRAELVFLIVLVFALSAIITLKVGGAMQEAYSASCASDAQTINQAVQAFLVETPQGGQVTREELTRSGLVGHDWAWPTSRRYDIEIAGDHNHLVGTRSSDRPAVHIADNDVIVRIGAAHFDVTRDPSGACLS